MQYNNICIYCLFRYIENSKIRSEIFKDTQIKPMDQAVYWVEYVIRHNGAYDMRSALNHAQYFLMDVCFVIISVILISAFIIVKITKFIVKTKYVNLQTKTNN